MLLLGGDLHRNGELACELLAEAHLLGVAAEEVAQPGGHRVVDDREGRGHVDGRWHASVLAQTTQLGLGVEEVAEA